MRDQLDVRTDVDAGVHVVRVKGRVDTVTADVLDKALDAVIGGGARKVVIDLANVDYMASAGLRSLLVALKAMTGLGGSVVLAAIHPRVQDVLKIAGLTPLFSIVPTAVDGVAALNQA